MAKMSMAKLIEIAKELSEKKAQLKELESEVEQLENIIKASMNEKKVQVLAIGNFVATWKPVKQSRFDTKTFKEDFVDLYKSYLKVKEIMRFDFA